MNEVRNIYIAHTELGEHESAMSQRRGKGRILMLNGCSSAGKTTLAWQLQSTAPGDWYWLALDFFLDAVPSRLWNRDNAEGTRVAHDLHHDCVKLACDQGKDVIVDTVLLSDCAYGLDSFLLRFREYDVLMVKVVCPPEELNRRERERGDRRIGQAVSQMDRIIPAADYDMTVDTHIQTTEECAAAILRMVEKPPEYTAFGRLCREFIRGSRAGIPEDVL